MEVKLLVGAESKQWLQDMESLTSRLEKVAAKIKGSASLKGHFIEEDEDEADLKKDAAADEDDGDFVATKKASKKAKSFDDDEEGETESTNDEEEFEAPTKKRAKKLTVDDVNDACKERATDEGGGKAGRMAVLGILKKKFKVQSVTDLDEKQYAAVISAMKS